MPSPVPSLGYSAEVMAKKAIDSRLGASLLEEVQDFLYMEDDCVDRLTGTNRTPSDWDMYCGDNHVICACISVGSQPLQQFYLSRPQTSRAIAEELQVIRRLLSTIREHDSRFSYIAWC